MGEPAFFIIGAPKCGTTALASYLSEHPRIFMTVPKEPLFFCTDMPGVRVVRTWRQYYGLFKSADPHALCGEASVLYMYSSEAIGQIKEAFPHAKLLVMLRRPDEMVYSMQRQLLFIGAENRESMRDAWDVEMLRRENRNVPKLCRNPKLLYYRLLARYGEQLTRVFDTFPRDKVHVVFYEDFSRDPRAVYESTLQFLEIPSDERREFPMINAHKDVRSKTLKLAMRWTFHKLHEWRLAVEDRTGLDASKLYVHKPITNLMAKANRKSRTKPPLDEALRREIVLAYRDDIKLLSSITGRNLDEWMK